MIILRQRQFSLVSKAYRWIKEMSKIDPLPISFEEYPRLIFPVKFVNGYIEKNWDNELLERLDKYYGKPGIGKIITKIGFGIAISQFPEDRNIKIEFDYPNDKIFKKAVDYSWEKIQRIPKRYITQSLGAGAYGIAFDYPGGKIEKISYRGFTGAEKTFYGYLKKHPRISIFPKIYAFEEDQVIMEKLILDSPKVQQYKGWIKEYIEKVPRSNPRLPNVRRPLWDKMESELGKDHEFTRFVRRVESEIEKIFGHRSIGDLSTSNIGERKGSGEIVFFDPITDGIETSGLKY